MPKVVRRLGFRFDRDPVPAARQLFAAPAVIHLRQAGAVNELLCEGFEACTTVPLETGDQVFGRQTFAARFPGEFAERFEEFLFAPNLRQTVDHHRTLAVDDRLVGVARQARIEPLTEDQRTDRFEGTTVRQVVGEVLLPGGVGTMVVVEVRHVFARPQIGRIISHGFGKPQIAPARPADYVAPPLVGDFVGDDRTTIFDSQLRGLFAARFHHFVGQHDEAVETLRIFGRRCRQGQLLARIGPVEG